MRTDEPFTRELEQGLDRYVRNGPPIGQQVLVSRHGMTGEVRGHIQRGEASVGLVHPHDDVWDACHCPCAYVLVEENRSPSRPQEPLRDLAAVVVAGRVEQGHRRHQGRS